MVNCSFLVNFKVRRRLACRPALTDATKADAFVIKESVKVLPPQFLQYNNFVAPPQFLNFINIAYSLFLYSHLLKQTNKKALKACLFM